MKKQMMFATLMLASMIGLAACSQPSQEKTTPADATATTSTTAVEDFSLKGVDGKTYHLSDFKGKKVYLKFWASWCSICLSTLEETQELAEEQEGKDYVVLTVVSPDHQGEQSEADFKAWAEKLDTNKFPILLDPDGSLIERYQVRAYPTQLFIDPSGNLAKTQVGFMDKTMIEDTLKSI